MNIPRISENYDEAKDILAYLKTGRGAMFQPVITILDGVIWFTTGSVLLSDREVLITDDVSRNTFGEADTVEDVLSVLDGLVARL